MPAVSDADVVVGTASAVARLVFHKLGAALSSAVEDILDLDEFSVSPLIKVVETAPTDDAKVVV